MDSILPERLLARPAKDSKSKTLRAGVWLQNSDPKICLQFAPGCISSEPTFAGLTKKKENKGFQKKGFLKKREKRSFGKA